MADENINAVPENDTEIDETTVPENDTVNDTGPVTDPVDDQSEETGVTDAGDIETENSGVDPDAQDDTPPAPQVVELNVGAVTAYGIAKKHGFVGTEEEWLESLAAESLPEVDIEDDGKVIQCVNGVWVAQKAELDNDTIAPLTNAEILSITAQ